MTLLELADLVTDLIKKHGVNAAVTVYDKVMQCYTHLDGTYAVKTEDFEKEKLPQPLIILHGE